MHCKNLTACLVLVVAFLVNANEEESIDKPQELLEHEIEELVVTGTLIKTSARSTATPLTSISNEQLESLGATDFKDIVRSLSFNAGSLGLTATNWAGDDSSTGNASINVRNLGNGATLVLLNGKRVVQSEFNQNGGSYVDIQTLIPNIAISRIDILKDGASAIYGSDAVAGVANLVTRDSFQGFELQTNLAVDHESGKQKDLSIQSIFGGEAENAHFTFAMSILDRSQLSYTDRFERFGRSGLSSFGQPGRYVPQTGDSGPKPVPSNFWWPSGGPDDAQFMGSLPDIDCEKAAQDDGSMGTLGIHPVFAHICVYDYSTFFAIVRPETQIQTYTSFHWHLGEFSHFYATLTSFRSSTTGGNSLYPDVRYVIVPDHNVGLRLDAARRGFEPVPYQALQRILGGTSQTDFEDRPVDTRDKASRDGFHYLIGFDSEFDFAGRSWHSDISLSLTNRKLSFSRPTDVISDRMNLAFEGLGGPDCDPDTGSPGSGNFGTGGCFYYNSFQSSVYDPVTGERWTDSDQPWAADPMLTVREAARKYKNSSELLQWLHGTYLTDRSIRQLVFDWVAHTDISEFRGYPVGLAIGTQARRESTKVDYDDVANGFGYSFLSGDIDWTNRISSWSVFSEIRVPISSRIEVNAALRNERISKPDASSLDPKLSILADLSDDLVLRMSWGTSFKVGSLLQTGGSRTIFRNSSDPFSNAVSLAYRPSQARGNSNLVPEVAETLSAGFTWEPSFLRGFQLNMDWYRYEYSDLIIREGHQALIDLDNALRCPDGINGDVTSGPLCGVWDHDNDGVETVFSVGTGIPEKVIRREDGYLVRTEPLYLNANSLSTSGVDVSSNYEIDFESLGKITFSLSATRYSEYSLQLRTGETIDGLGRRNATNPISRPMPKFRARFGVDWTARIQSASVSVNTVDGYRDESTQTAFLGAYLGYSEYIKSMSTVDAQYRFKLRGRGSEDSSVWLSIGMKNLLNREPPLVIVDGAYDYYTHDPRGRIYYLRAHWVNEG